MSDARFEGQTLGREVSDTMIVLRGPSGFLSMESGIPDGKLRAKVAEALRKYLSGEVREITIHGDIMM